MKKDDLLDQRAKLHDKIMHLYAPMVGNRLVHSMAVKSFEDKHKMPIEDVMKIICEKRDSEALENWRCFYTKNLDELDKTFMTGIFHVTKNFATNISVLRNMWVTRNIHLKGKLWKIIRIVFEMKLKC